MKEHLDCSVPRETAEKHLKSPPGSATLDELARRMSIEATNYLDDPISVRDVNLRPIPHSGVYYRGERLPQTPWLTRR